MKLNKIFDLLWLLPCMCFVLLSSCGTDNSRTSTSTTPPMTHTSPVPTTTASTTLSTDCPATGTVRGANLPAATGPAQPAVFYLTLWGGVQSGLNPLNLIRYDLTTGKTITLLTFTGLTVGVVPLVHLSPDKHWLLIINGKTLNNTTSITEVQLMRTEGTQLQTLACSSSDSGLSADWLPDGQHVAIISNQYDQQQKALLYTVNVLNLATGKSQTDLSGDYSPYAWLDDHRLIVAKTTTNTNMPDRTDFFLFDTNNGSHQKITDLTSIASFATWGSFVYGNIAVSSDSSQLFISSFTQAKTNSANCQGATTQGPGTLSAHVINGGTTHTIYSNQSHAILAIHPVNTNTLLMYIENNTGDLSQNGLWKINSDGTGPTRLTTANDPQCRDLNYEEWSPQIASNSQSYALVQTDFNKGEIQSLVLGRLSGSAPTTIATSVHVSPKPGSDGFLQLVGMA
jgi:hypothetical protein